MENAGGIVAELTSSTSTSTSYGNVDYCYNLGTVSGKQYTAGIVGHGSGSYNINNCRNSGSISSTHTTNFGAIVGNYSTSSSQFSVRSCYYTSSSCSRAVGNNTYKTVGCTTYTTSDYQSSVWSTVNNSAWTRVSGMNNGYPVLKWQVK